MNGPVLGAETLNLSCLKRVITNVGIFRHIKALPLVRYQTRMLDISSRL